jgi:class 3 adenylate cyclase
MDSNYKAYDHLASLERLDEIIATPRGNFEEVKELPDRDRLTYANGFYALCSAVFVDLRESSELPNHYNRPSLAKLYRAFISESIAILNSNAKAREINIVGDCVWGVFNTPKKDDINDLFDRTAMLNSMMKVLNYKFEKAGYSTPIRAGIGIAYGRALMIQAGYKGTGIYDVVYMGDVVNYASKLAARANVHRTDLGPYTYSPPVYLENDIVYNLTDKYKGFVQKDSANDCYTADIVNIVMNDWFKENCK